MVFPFEDFATKDAKDLSRETSTERAKDLRFFEGQRTEV